MKKSSSALLVFSLLLATNMQAQEKHLMSAQQAAEYARKNNAAVKNALVDVQIQAQTNREITAAAYPQITGSAGTAYSPKVITQTFPNFIAMGTYGVLAQEGVKNGSGQDIKMPADFGFIQASFGTKWSSNAGVDLQQLLFEGQVFVGLQARRTAMDFAMKGAEVTEENIKANIYKIYYQLAASKNQIAILDANIVRLQRMNTDVQKLYSAGFIERIEIDKVNVQLTNLQTDRQRVVNGIENGFLGLKLLMGMPVQDTLVLTDSIGYEEIRNDVLDATQYRYEDRKEFQYASLGRKMNEYNIRRYKLTQVPTVALGANYGVLKQANEFGFGGRWYPNSTIGLRVNVPIFDGFARAARIQKAKLELEQTNNRIEDLKKTIDRDVRQAINNYNTALLTLDNQKRNMELAERVYTQTKKKYEIGTGSSTEISNSDADLRVAQTNYINALYDAIIARIDFLQATGKLQ